MPLPMVRQPLCLGSFGDKASIMELMDVIFELQDDKLVEKYLEEGHKGLADKMGGMNLHDYLDGVLGPLTGV